MGQNKEQLRQLLAFIKTLVKQPGNDEFIAGLHALLLPGVTSIDQAKLDEIYEYCLERNSRIQGEEYYKNFPIKEVIPDLVESYVMMESFKRRGDFINYSANVFKQLESISNYICSQEDYATIFSKLYDKASLIACKSGESVSISSRKESSKPIYKLIYDGFEMTLDGKAKYTFPLNKQQIQDKVKIALYFAGYASCLFNDYEFKNIAFEIFQLYLVRCEAYHGGSTRTEKQEQVFQDVIMNSGIYYVKFFVLLHNFVAKLSSGYKQKDELHKYALSMGLIEVEGTVTSKLPSALYIKMSDDSTMSAPISSFERIDVFNPGMDVIVSFQDGKIVKVIPKE